MSRDAESKFRCDRCGLCCRKLKGSPLAMFDRGDGVCRYLNEDNLCSIYENRPLICNVDKLYDKKYSGRITREVYHLLQEQACKALKEEANRLLGGAMPTIRKAFISFAEDLARELKSNAITSEQACERLKGFGYKITDSGCFYRTFTMAGSSSKFYIHIWGTLVSEKPWVEEFTGIAWGDKNGEVGRLEV